MTFCGGNTFHFRSSQQLPRLRLSDPWRSFWADTASFKGPQLASCAASITTEKQGRCQVWRTRGGCPRTQLKNSWREPRLLSISYQSLIVKSQPNRIELVTRRGMTWSDALLLADQSPSQIRQPSPRGRYVGGSKHQAAPTSHNHRRREVEDWAGGNKDAFLPFFMPESMET